MMIFLLLIAILLNPFRPCEGLSTCRKCEGPPTYQEEYRGNYVPNVIETKFGLQVMAPDTPYVAVAGQDKLYFIDTRLDTETAKHVKQQIEKASVPKLDEHIYIDEIEGTAELRDNLTNETTFMFDPFYARVLFARGMNRRNPKLNLPDPEPAGDWLVTYDLDSIPKERASRNSRASSLPDVTV